MTYNPFTLFFINDWAHLEPEFLKFHFRESLVRIRIATLVAASFYAAFGILDAVLIPEKKIIFWAIRYIVVVPVAIGTLVFSFSPRFEKFAQASLFFMCLVGGLGIELMVLLARPPVTYSYYAGIILIFITIHTFLPMRFLWASACSWSIVLFYEIIAFWVVDTPVAILINNNFFFVSANILCMLAGYSIELNARRRFFANHMLSRVTFFTDSTLAIEYFKAHVHDVDLVITDFTMPEITGLEVSKQVLAVCRDMPVILCTGYSENITYQRMRPAGIKAFLMKPVIKQTLAKTVRQVLDQAQKGNCILV